MRHKRILPQKVFHKKKKGELPTKICAVCGRPFEWRKRWRLNWEEVRYCSERCRRTHHSA